MVGDLVWLTTYSKLLKIVPRVHTKGYMVYLWCAHSRQNPSLVPKLSLSSVGVKLQCNSSSVGIAMYRVTVFLDTSPRISPAQMSSYKQQLNSSSVHSHGHSNYIYMYTCMYRYIVFLDIHVCMYNVPFLTLCHPMIPYDVITVMVSL